TMPKLSDTMEEGKIIRWLKRPGDAIRVGEVIAEVETDKADMVLEAFDDGVLEEIKLQEGETAPVGAVIATLRPLDAAARAAAAAKPVEKKPEPKPVTRRARKEGPPAPSPALPSAAAAAAEAAYAAPQFHPAMSAIQSAAPTAIPMPPRPPARTAEPSAAPAPAVGEKLRASPLARRAAEEAGVDLSQVRGTGPEGRITKRDLDNYLRQEQLFRFRRLVAPREGEPGSREEFSKMRKSIALRTATSKREIPHFYLTMDVDMEEAVKLKKSLEATELFEEEISYNDIIVKACALALSRYPRINASYQDEGIVIHPHINIAFAVAVEDGLLLPVVKECERLSLPEIARTAHLLVAKSGRGGFTTDELSGATFTISNMGMLGVEHFAAVIVPPQAAILAVSAIKDRPVVRDGQLAVGKTMMLTISCDHRIVDGVVAGRFIGELKRFLENPASLLV
ncbi:MAG TPA: dihydrolipoamide acetyltransferase family protein, partial [Candidatus Binataceae bacterium]|nr:dihydrolipoamide acetyltransferase family protein [Candidatus Binataceae bacterium]